jgi:23S rRNA (uracil1939-C5)-methyltransferase
LNDPQTIDVEILQLVYGGDGMARLADGRAVFVPFTLPQEVVRIEIIEEKKGFSRGRLVEVLRPSPLRIEPRCIHFAHCGGCHYQHLDYAGQLKVKQRVFTEQLVRLAGIANPPVEPIIPSPQAWNYRSEMQFHLSESGAPGFMAAASERVIAIEECHLPMSGIDSLWPRLDFEEEPAIRRIEILQGSDDEILLTLQGQGDLPALELDLPVSVVYRNEQADWVLAGDPYVLMKVKERPFSVSAGSFFQVNPYLVPRMVDEILGSLRLDGMQTLFDLYCGVGLFSAFLAPRVRELIGVEQSESACVDFSVNLDDASNVSLYQGAVEDVLPGLNARPDVIIIDPPRAGLHKRALDEIVAKAPAQLVYVSCDPSTLARDLKRLLEGGYRVEKIVPLDLFPQTYHVESITLMTNSGPKSKIH